MKRTETKQYVYNCVYIYMCVCDCVCVCLLIVYLLAQDFHRKIVPERAAGLQRSTPEPWPTRPKKDWQAYAFRYRVHA